MAKKFFSAEMDPACRYCSVGTPNIDDDYVLCPKKGVMSACSSCPSFRYDPLRREVRRMPHLDTSGYTADTFKL